MSQRSTEKKPRVSFDIHADDTLGKIAIRFVRHRYPLRIGPHDPVRIGQAYVAEQNTGRWLLHAVDIMPEFQRQGHGTRLMQRVLEYLKVKQAVSLHAALEGSGMVQILHRLCGDRACFKAHGEQLTYEEAVHIMDVEFGRCIAEVTLV